MDDYRKNITIALSLLIVFMLYVSNKLKPANFVAVLLIVGLSFLAPIVSMVFIIPIFLIVVLSSSQGVSSTWSTIKSAKLQ